MENLELIGMHLVLCSRYDLDKLNFIMLYLVSLVPVMMVCPLLSQFWNAKWSLGNAALSLNFLLVYSSTYNF